MRSVLDWSLPQETMPGPFRCELVVVGRRLVLGILVWCTNAESTFDLFRG